MTTETITVLGAGSWGATLGTLLAEKGHTVRLWEFSEKIANQLQSTHRLSTLPDLVIPQSVSISSSIADSLKGATLVLVATPSQVVRNTLNAAKKSGALTPTLLYVNVSKGLEEKSHKRMSQIIQEETGCALDQMVILSGPSHAEEVCRKVATAVVAGGISLAATQRVQALFSTDYFRIYTQTDLIGVELGGTLKNILAIGCGISDGLGLGDNTKAAMVTRGLYEMSRLGVQLGAELMTFFGLAGIGDLIVTALSTHSRNRSFGEKIGKGKTPAEALKEMTMVVEGYATCAAAYSLAKQLNIDCPLINEIYHVLYEGKPPKQSLHDLMRRDVQPEWGGLTK